MQMDGNTQFWDLPCKVAINPVDRTCFLQTQARKHCANIRLGIVDGAFASRIGPFANRKQTKRSHIYIAEYQSEPTSLFMFGGPGRLVQ